jgi:hypothetical protein
MIRRLPRFVLVLPLLWLGFSRTAHAADCGNPLTGLEDGVYLYANADYRGRCERFTADVERLAGTVIRDNSVVSVRIVGNYAATIYSERGWTGASSTFVTSISDLGGSAVGRDRGSSLRVRKSNCDGEPGVYLFQFRDFGGRCSKFKANADELRTEYVQQDTASSIKIIGSWTVVLHQAADRRGVSSRFTTSVRDLSGTPVGNNAARSVTVTPGERTCDGGAGVYLYADTRFRGACSRLTNTSGDLSAYEVGDDTVSSIRLVGGYGATLFVDKTYGGSASDFTADDPDLGNDAVGRDHASSIRVTGPNEAERVYRLQMRIETGDVDEAGTDDDVLVSLDKDNVTWLDYGRDDFRRGDIYTYDLITDNISKMSSIKWITFSKTGSDGWCLKSFELRINHQSERLPPVRIYREEFPVCRWIDNNDGHQGSLTVPFSRLREAPSWSGARVPGVVGVIEAAEVVSRVESLVGHHLHYQSRGFWGQSHGKSVEIALRVDPRTRREYVHVDLDLAASPNVEVDIDFDLSITCDPRTVRLVVAVENVSADLNPFVDWYGGGLERQIERAFPGVLEALPTGLPACPNIKIENDGTVRVLG